jgi:hypothetical protein
LFLSWPQRRATKSYLEALEIVTAVLGRVDPVGISYVPDEYSPEAARIVARSRGLHNVDDVRQVVTDVFDEMFWPGACKSETANDIAVELLPVLAKLHSR